MIKIPHQSKEMYDRRTNYYDMYYLMAAPKKIKRPPPKLLGEFRSIRNRVGCIEF
jgi:hypothetical protein